MIMMHQEPTVQLEINFQLIDQLEELQNAKNVRKLS